MKEYTESFIYFSIFIEIMHLTLRYLIHLFLAFSFILFVKCLHRLLQY